RLAFCSPNDRFPEYLLPGRASSFDDSPFFRHYRGLHLGLGFEPVIDGLATTPAAPLVNFISAPRDQVAQVGLSNVSFSLPRTQLEPGISTDDGIEDQPRLLRVKIKVGRRSLDERQFHHGVGAIKIGFHPMTHPVVVEL